MFFTNYFSHWSLGFLVLRGDMNLRHSTGQAGIVFVVVFLLFIAGLIGMLARRNLDRFKLFLLLNLLASPVAAALTYEGTPHAQRSLLLGYYILLISCYGLNDLLAINPSWARISLLACVFVLLLYEVIHYQVDYFIHYSARSVDAIGSYDFRNSLQFAIGKDPKEIILFNNFGAVTKTFSSTVRSSPTRGRSPSGRSRQWHLLPASVSSTAASAEPRKSSIPIRFPIRSSGAEGGPPTLKSNSARKRLPVS